VKFVPSMRNVFSFVLDPNDDTVLFVPLAAELGDIPGAARRVGIVPRRSD
jgi:hypothetical protein